MSNEQRKGLVLSALNVLRMGERRAAKRVQPTALCGRL